MRRVLAVGLVVSPGLAGVVVTLWALLWSGDPVTSAGFAQIRMGMTETEVAAILGVPPGYYADRDVGSLVDDPALYELTKTGESKEWHGNRWWILVSFDDQGRVKGKSINPCLPSLDTLRGKMNSWLGSHVF